MWASIKKFFLFSETIFLARAQVFLGAVLATASTIDPNMFMSMTGRWFPIFLIFHGALGEYLRKRRDTELKSRGR